MKKFNLLSKSEMKNVLGGNPPEDDEIGGDDRKIKACEGKNYNDYCHFTATNGIEYGGKCLSFFAGPLFCSTLM